jgi:hypothetical protein
MKIHSFMIGRWMFSVVRPGGKTPAASQEANETPGERVNYDPIDQRPVCMRHDCAGRIPMPRPHITIDPVEGDGSFRDVSG